MPKADPKRVGARLRAVMLDPDLGLETVEDFAKFVCVERNAASNWLNGYHLPRVPVMGTLIEKYAGLTLDWIYFGNADAVPLKLAIKLAALLERVPVPPVLPEPSLEATGSSAAAKKRRVSRKKATSHR